MDYIVRYNYDLAVVASGNFRPSGCGTNTDWVTSPGKGYNVLTVGNYRDNGSVSWSDDTMNSTSQYNETGRYKPEMAASGTNITGLSTSSPWYGTTGTGTSFASPMVAAAAADMIEADSVLSIYPEATTAVLMATALHNIEGDETLSRADGVGSLDAAAALASVERGHFSSTYISSSTSFPLTFTQFAYKGERVRYVIRWLSNPNSSYTDDPLPADLDLEAYRSDGTTFIDGSYSGSNSFEIVDFIAPESETYIFKVDLWGSWDGGGTYLGRGWWRGTYRISPGVGYSDPKATPMGTHLSVHPTDWTPTIYWRAMGIRPDNSDTDIYLYSTTIFDDPSLWSLHKASTWGGESVDYITVDGNHWPSSDSEEYVVRNYSGDGGYRTTFSNPGIILSGTGFYGPYTMGSANVVMVFDAKFYADDIKRIMIIPDNNYSDLGARLYRSYSSDPDSWTRNKSSSVATADTSTTPDSTESMIYSYDGTSMDYLGLVVYSKDYASARFYIYYGPNAAYLPLILK